MGAALILLLVGLGAMAAGVLIGRYYVPDDRQLRRSAKHSRAYMRALSHLIARDYDTVVGELRTVVEENVDDVEPYFALGAVFRSRGEHERAIRVHQALAMRERDRRKVRQRAMYELGLDFRAAGMPRRATRAMEEVMLDDAGHEGAGRVLAALYEEQARFNEAAGLWQRIGRRRGEDTGHREHHLLIAAAQTAIGRDDLDSARQLLKAAQKHDVSAHFYAAAAELAAARGNHRGARERIKQALAADAGLAPHLLPWLIAAEQGLAAHAAAGARPQGHADADDLDDDHADARSVAGSAPQLPSAAAPQLPSASSSQLPSASSSQLPSAASHQLPSGSGHPLPSASSHQLPSVSSSQLPSVSSPYLASGSPSPLPAASQWSGDPSPLMVDDSPPVGPAAAAEVAAPRVADGPAETALATSPRAAVVASPTGASPEPSAASTMLASLRGAQTAGSRKIDFVALGPEAGGASPAVIERVLATLDEVEAQGGPRLELALIRAQLVPPADAQAQAQLAAELTARFPASIAARVAAGRLASASNDPAAIRGALDGLVSETGALAWALRGRWQCGHCGARPASFSWRCGQCRRWSTLRMETGIEPPPIQPRERRAASRTAGRPDGLLGASPELSLPAATLDPGLSDAELASAGVRRSLLGRVGGWVSGVLRRDPP